MVYWSSQIGSDAIAQLLVGKDASDFTLDHISCSFEKKMYPRKVDETLEWLPIFLERTRLHLLVITSASLEAYLKDAVFHHLASTGYVKRPEKLTDPLKLNAVGEALGYPILGKSSVPEPLKYCEELLGVDYGGYRSTWTHAYRLRCIAAHTGGMVTSKDLKHLKAYDEHDMIGLSWAELRKAMDAADQIVTITDNKISTQQSRIIEAECVLRALKAKGALPKKHKLWQTMHDEYVVQVNRVGKRFLEDMFY